MDMRSKRLRSDYNKIATAFSGRDRIRILNVVGDPPEKYQLEYLITGLQQSNATKSIKTHNSFIVEVTLTKAYPRMAPQCRMLTPVFHPNIAPHAICIGDHWAAGESLLNLLVRIAEMLSFQSYNVKSPLNGEAAKWVELNREQLPLDNYDFSSLLNVGEAIGRDANGNFVAGKECANCGATCENEVLKVCVNGHTTCENCVVECAGCHSILCLKCNSAKCVHCGEYYCYKCLVKCQNCGKFACSTHTIKCHICGQMCCSDCTENCARCGKAICLQHIRKVSQEDKHIYLCDQCA